MKASDGYHLWARQFDRRMQDLLDIEAYRLYLRGRYFFAKRTPQALLNAIECFDRAIARDPAMALAYAGLADCHVRLGSFALAPEDSAYERAKAASLRALELNSRVAEAHVTLGFVTANAYDWVKGEEEFRRAIELNPYNAGAHTLYSAIPLCQRRFDEGELELALAHRFDPAWRSPARRRVLPDLPPPV